MKVHNMHYLGDCERERANSCILDFSASDLLVRLAECTQGKEVRMVPPLDLLEIDTFSTHLEC